MKFVFYISLTMVLLIFMSAGAVIRPVPGEYPTIQAAINASQNGDEVVIADGVYAGFGNFNIGLSGKAITVRSESGDPNSCIINIPGQHNGQLQRGFTLTSAEGRGSVIKDISIINGVADAP